MSQFYVSGCCKACNYYGVKTTKEQYNSEVICPNEYYHYEEEIDKQRKLAKEMIIELNKFNLNK